MREREGWGDFFYRPILVAGKRVGTWRRTASRGSLLLDARFFAALDDALWGEREAAATRLGAFLGLPATVVRFA